MNLKCHVTPRDANLEVRTAPLCKELAIIRFICTASTSGKKSKLTTSLKVFTKPVVPIAGSLGMNNRCEFNLSLIIKHESD
jgi:hypothetical protein